MFKKKFGGTSTSGNHDLTTLVHSSLMATTSENDNCNSICVAKAPGPTFTVTFSPKVSPLKKEVDYAGISPIWRIRGFHKQLQSSSWLHGKMEQRKNTVPT